MFDQHILTQTAAGNVSAYLVFLCQFFFRVVFGAPVIIAKTVLGYCPSLKHLKMNAPLARRSIGLFAVAGINNDSNKQKQVREQL